MRRNATFRYYGILKKLGSYLEFKISDFGYSALSRYLCRPKFKGFECLLFNNWFVKEERLSGQKANRVRWTAVRNAGACVPACTPPHLKSQTPRCAK